MKILESPTPEALVLAQTIIHAERYLYLRNSHVSDAKDLAIGSGEELDKLCDEGIIEDEQKESTVQELTE